VKAKSEGGAKKGGVKEKKERKVKEKQKETKKEKEKKKKKKVVSSSSEEEEEEEEEGDVEESASDSSDEGQRKSKKTAKGLSLDTRSPYKAPEIDLLSMFGDVFNNTDNNVNTNTNSDNNVYNSNKSSNSISNNNNNFYNGNTSTAASQYQQRAATSMHAPNGSPPPRSTPAAPGTSLWPKGSPTPPPLEPMTPLPSSATAHTDVGGAVPERATAVVAAALNLVSLQYDLKGEALRECLMLALQRLSTEETPPPDPLDSPAAKDSSSPSKPAQTFWPADESSQKQKQKQPVTPTTSALQGLWGDEPLAPPVEAKTEGEGEDFFGGLGLWDGTASAYTTTTTTTSSSATPVKKTYDAAAPSALNFDVDFGPSEPAEEPNPFLIGNSFSSVLCLLFCVCCLLSAVCCLLSFSDTQPNPFLIGSYFFLHFACSVSNAPTFRHAFLFCHCNATVTPL
jgi:hypothetical protein